MRMLVLTLLTFKKVKLIFCIKFFASLSKVKSRGHRICKNTLDVINNDAKVWNKGKLEDILTLHSKTPIPSVTY